MDESSSDCNEFLDLTTEKIVKKLSDKRAHINRDNWNENLAAKLIAQVELYPGLFLLLPLLFYFILLPFQSFGMSMQPAFGTKI